MSPDEGHERYQQTKRPRKRAPAAFPGHHDTCARIMCALPRMKPKEQTNAIRTRRWISLPGTWIWRS
jgi:hypothetical protein